MENVLLKEKLKFLIPTSLISLFVGILVDHYIIYPYFDFGKKNQEDTSVESNIDISNEQIIGEDKVLELEKNTSCKMYVDVSGALKEPGVYCMEEGSLLIDAVNKAGGFSSDVAYRFISRKINLAQEVVNNQKLYFPFEEEMECSMVSFLPEAKEVEIIISDTTDITDTTNTTDSTEDTTIEDNTEEDSLQCVNINSATLSELDSLNGIGASTAQKIIDSRPYGNLEDLLQVSGIGESTYNKFKEDICI